MEIYQSNYTAANIDTAISKTYRAVTLNTAPNANTKTYTNVFGDICDFSIGDEVRVPNVNGYEFYKLYDLAESGGGTNAVWKMIWNSGYTQYAFITVNQGTTNELAMITGDVRNEVIQTIRNNSHLYLGKQVESGKQLICQLSDSNGNQYADGTIAAFDGTEGDHWLRICVNVYIKRMTVDGDKTTYGIAIGLKPDNTWKELITPNDLLGVHEAYTSNSKLYSRSGIASSGNLGKTEARTYARNRGSGYTAVTWEWHCFMALMFLCWYGRTNSQAQCGTGANSYNRTLGNKNNIGMTDTTSSNGNDDDTKFWGIENWWGDKFEVIDNVEVGSDDIWTVTDTITGSERIIGKGISANSGTITKMMLTEYADFVPTEISGTNDTLGYCDRVNRASGASPVCRSNSFNGTPGGVFYLVSNGNSTYAANGTRLAFHGNVEVNNNVAVYKAATNIG